MNDERPMIWEEAVRWLKAQPEQAALVEACFYDDPLEAAAKRYYESPEWQAVRSILSGRSGAALDIGAGRGISSYALARDGWRVSALEPDPSGDVGAGAIKRLSAEAAVDIEIVEEWGEKLPFADDQFDLVYCRAVLHHARNLDDLCSEAARVLRHGGLFVATREHVLSKSSDLDAFLTSHPLHSLYGGEHAYLLSEYVSSIQKAGLKLTSQLNPNASNINLYPNTQDNLKQSWAARFHFPISSLIPNFILKFMGEISNQPGRLYSFVAVKR